MRNKTLRFSALLILLFLMIQLNCLQTSDDGERQNFGYDGEINKSSISGGLVTSVNKRGGGGGGGRGGGGGGGRGGGGGGRGGGRGGRGSSGGDGGYGSSTKSPGISQGRATPAVIPIYGAGGLGSQHRHNGGGGGSSLRCLVLIPLASAISAFFILISQFCIL